MFDNDNNIGLMERPGTDGFRFQVTDVTGTQTLVASDVSPDISAGAVAEALAERMALPNNVPWTLRDDASAGYLDDQRAIGDQVADQATLTITPKTHLG